MKFLGCATPKGFHIPAQWLRRSAVLRRYPGLAVQQNSPTLKAVASLICPDFAGPDGDGLNNSQEWRADTNPMDALSALKMTSLDLGLTEMLSYQETASAPTRFFRLKCSLQ